MKPGNEKLYSVLFACNVRCGMEPAAALEHALAVTELLAAKFGGQALYVNLAEENSERDSAIVKLRLAGWSMRRIARELSVSRGCVEHVLRREGVLSFALTSSHARAEGTAQPVTA